MDSSLDSQENIDAKALLLQNDDHHCEKLFDEIFQHDENNENDPELKIKRPIKTYLNTAKFVRFENNHIFDEDDQNANNDKFDPVFQPKKEPTKKKPRKRKLKLPDVKKEAVIEAFTKAIENHELPNFEEIEKFPLSIVVETSKDKQEFEKPTKKSRKKSQESTKTNKKSTSKKSTKKDEENENSFSIPPEQAVNLRRSNRTRRVLSDINSNQTEKTLTNLEHMDNHENNLFNLDESCIPKVDDFNAEPSQFSTRSSKRIQQIQSSTPFTTIQKTTRIKKTKDVNTTKKTKGKLFSSDQNR